ncbi:MAG: 3'-5' exonuclease [Sphaerochaetaceae bacterium]
MSYYRRQSSTARFRAIEEKKKAAAWARSVIERKDVLLFDTETTGLGPDARIVEISVLSTQGRLIASELLDPEIVMPEKVSMINGITAVMLQGRRKFWEIAPNVARLMSDGTFVAWNTPFDIARLQYEFERISFLYPSPDIDDAMVRYCRFSGRTENRCAMHKASDELGITMTQQHRSAGDCRMMLEIIRRMAQWEDK